MRVLTEKSERIRFLKFAVVGVTGTIVDFGIMNLLTLVFHLPLNISQAISFIAAVINNFLWNRYWTYPESREASAPRQLSQFFLINLIGILVRTPLVTYLNQLILSNLGERETVLSLQPSVISQNLSLAISISIILLWNYFANRYWTYGDIPSGKPQEDIIEK